MLTKQIASDVTQAAPHLRDDTRTSSEEGDAECCLESIQDLTTSLLQDILRENWILPDKFQAVQSLSAERIEQGVLSQVFRVRVTYDFEDSSLEQEVSDIPTEWIVKLPRRDLHLEWMFRSEKVFYETIAPIINEANLPFTIPRMLLACERCLILEGIKDITCHGLMAGTPAEKLDYATHALASLHAFSWNSKVLETKTKDLEKPPGMGQRLNPLQKEYLFAQQWRDAVEAIGLEDTSIKTFIVQLCKQMEQRRLRDIHCLVHTERLACVHGDFHIANFLFPNLNDETSKSDSRPYLVDWAAFGYGNPMTDVAFFLVLNENAATDVVAWLQLYHEKLIGCNPDLHALFSMECMLEKIRWAMLYQWMILVAYDKMSRQLSEGDPKKMKHFVNVNRRAVLALYDIPGFELNKLPLVSDEEHEEARVYSSEKPLSI